MTKPTPSRRALLAGAPAVAAAALAAGGIANTLAAASAVDPVFAAIDCHREAVRICEEAASRFRKLDEEWDARARTGNDTPRDIAYDDWNDATNTVLQTTDMLVKTSPTTLSGAAAALTAWSEFMEFVMDGNNDYDFLEVDCSSALLSNIAAALTRIEGAQS
jgi:hypothetical protein